MDKMDLHMHSLYSDDGEYIPSRLVEMCAEKGINIMAIADHNSVKAVEEGKLRAAELEIMFIPAIEIDCTYRDVNFHMLGYDIDYTDSCFTEIEENVLNQELTLSAKKMGLVKKLGFEITEEEMRAISPQGIYTGEMFAEVLLGKEEYKDNSLLLPYRKDGKRSDNPYVNFYWDYFSQGKPCYTKVEYPKLVDIVNLIRAKGGKAVLAHPGVNLKNHFELFDQMVQDVPLDGVEAFSSYHDEETVEYFYNKGKEYNLVISCGSDFHGKTKPAIELGDSHCLKMEECVSDFLKYLSL